MIKNFCKLFFIFSLVFFFSFSPLSANAYQYVSGYYRSNGTYVAPYVRSEPNGLKYDNYSWTPSQGLYNSTYGTKGSEWDTPTYITDPDYYIGKSIYDSNNSSPSYSSNSYSSYSNVYSSLLKTPSCPLMSSYDYSSETCKCFSGYSVVKDSLGNESCKSYDSQCRDLNGYNSSYNLLTSSCECSYGYVYNGKECVSKTSYCTNKLGLMSTYNSLTQKCECIAGYELVGSVCTYKSKINSYSNYNYYNTSDYSDTYCPDNSFLSTDNKCYCNEGYDISSDKTSCIKKECTSNSTFRSGSCQCNNGYEKVNGECLSYNNICKNSFGDSLVGFRDEQGKIKCRCKSDYLWSENKKSCILSSSIKQHIITSYVINIRKLPSLNSDILGKTVPKDKYEVVDLDIKNWIKIKYNDVFGYVYKSFTQVVKNTNSDVLAPIY